MNTHLRYERREDRSVASEEPAPTQPDGSEPAALAMHRDPSLTDTTQARPSGSERGIAWVRPGELPTVVGTRWASRGIDLQAELMRRARRAPIGTVRAARRITRTSLAGADTGSPTSSTEELTL